MYFGTRLLLVWFCVCAASGCISLSSWTKKGEVEVQTPSKIVAIWTNSVFSETGKKPVRGLGGRVYFYDGQHNPIEVDGKLSVFLYDDSDPSNRTKQEATQAIHFSAEEVAAKYTPTDFGPSYSFWVPWDEVGGDRTQLSVIPVFTSIVGEMIVGEQARHVLPGKRRDELAETKEGRDAGIQQAQFVSGEPDANKARSSEKSDSRLRIESTTIKLPPSMRQRLRASGSTRARSIGRKASELARRPQETSSTASPERRAKSKSVGRATLDSLEATDSSAQHQSRITRRPSADSRFGPRQVQAEQSSRQATSPAQNPLGLGGSRFSRL